MSISEGVKLLFDITKLYKTDNYGFIDPVFSG